MPLALHPYRPDDRSACLTIFDGNTPRFFDPSEKTDFAGFLEAGPDDYFVVTDGNEVVGCGGVFVRDGTGGPCRGGLCWGMVESTRHRTGVGSFLLRQRLAHLAETYPQLDAVLLDTSQHSRGFFARFGFETVKVTPDAYAPGLDRYDMRLSRGTLLKLKPYG